MRFLRWALLIAVAAALGLFLFLPGTMRSPAELRARAERSAAAQTQTPEPLPQPEPIPFDNSSQPVLESEKESDIFSDSGDMEPPPEPMIPDSAAHFSAMIEKISREDGPYSIDHGNRMIASTNAVLRAVGYALLSAGGSLNPDLLAQLAHDPDLPAPLMVLEWLQNTGDATTAVELASLLNARMEDTKSVEELLQTGALKAGGGGAALSILKNRLSDADMAQLCRDVSANPEQDTAIRMRAATEMRDHLPLPDYVKLVGEIQGEDSSDSPWNQWLDRLSARVSGPADVLQNQVLSSADVEEALAREHPLMFEDVALQLEYAASHDTCRVVSGTVERVRSTLVVATDRPLTDAERLALRRIETALVTLSEAERQRPASDDAPPR